MSTLKLAVAGATAAAVVIGYYYLFTENDDDYDDGLDEKIKLAEARRRSYRSEVVNLTFRALKAVALADGIFHEKEREMLTRCEEVLTVASPDLDALEPITPEALANHSLLAKEPEKQAYLLILMVHLSLVDGDEHPKEVALVKRFADAFGVTDSVFNKLRSTVLKQHAVVESDLEKKYNRPQLKRGTSTGSTALLLGSTDFCSALSALCHR